MRIGAVDYLIKPFALEELTSVLGRSSSTHYFGLESRRLRERLHAQTGLGGLIGSSPEMEKIYQLISKVAFSNHSVLILGESGTGKEMVARAIHNNGPNAAKPFIPAITYLTHKSWLEENEPCAQSNGRPYEKPSLSGWGRL
jgi:two-component system response regulator HydG